MSKTLCIFGTASNVGKSTVTMALCRLFKNSGVNVAPFKAQNMSNNAGVADDGSEIARAQIFQAEACEAKTSWRNNPILLKPIGNTSSQVVLKGKVWGQMSAKEYYQNLDMFKSAVDEALGSLECDLIVAEGAGSPVELNLMRKDLANIYTAKNTDAKIVLVASIDEGGVFASIHGTLELLPNGLRQNVIGVIINKFRGDIELFKEGIKIIEKRFRVPVLGVLPYTPLILSAEDSLNLSSLFAKKPQATIRVGVVTYPKISNFDDLDPFALDASVELAPMNHDVPLEPFDVIVLPGSKNVINDLKWLKECGLFDRLKKCKKPIFGICGGYQMLHNKLVDEQGVESGELQSVDGFGLIDGDIEYRTEKRVEKGEFLAFGEKLNGYLMHCGVSSVHPLFFEEANIAGTHLHHVFHNDNFRTRFLQNLNPKYQGFDFLKTKSHFLDEFCEAFEKNLDFQKIKEALCI